MLLGRAGSVGVKGKNVKDILGRPSLHYPLMAAHASGVVNDLYVSTDSEEIIRLAQPFGAYALQRPSPLASNTALLEDAIAWTFNKIETLRPRTYDLYLILLCNAVTVLPDRIRAAYDLLQADPSIDAVVTAAKWNMFSPLRARALDRTTGWLRPYVSLNTLRRSTSISCDRDQSTNAYFCDHSFSLTRRATLKRLTRNPGPFKWMGRRIRMIEQMPGTGDIDLPWQLPVVEWWLRQHGFSETDLPYEQTMPVKESIVS
jgi:hypothetical protein